MEFFNSPSSNAAEIQKNLSSETTAMKSFLHFNVSQVHKTFLAVSSFRHIPCELKT